MNARTPASPTRLSTLQVDELILTWVPSLRWNLPTDEPARSAEILRRLERALRAERARGRAGHPAYNLVRHANLARLVRLQARIHRRALREIKIKAAAPGSPEPPP